MAVFVVEFGKTGNRLTLKFRMDCLKQFQSLGSDLGDCLSLVIAAALAPNQAPCLQAVDEPGDIGSAFHHALGNFAARMPLGMHSTEDS